MVRRKFPKLAPLAFFAGHEVRLQTVGHPQIESVVFQPAPRDAVAQVPCLIPLAGVDIFLQQTDCKGRKECVILSKPFQTPGKIGLQAGPVRAGIEVDLEFFARGGRLKRWTAFRDTDVGITRAAQHGFQPGF